MLRDSFAFFIQQFPTICNINPFFGVADKRNLQTAHIALSLTLHNAFEWLLLKPAKHPRWLRGEAKQAAVGVSWQKAPPALICASYLSRLDLSQSLLVGSKWAAERRESPPPPDRR